MIEIHQIRCGCEQTYTNFCLIRKHLCESACAYFRLCIMLGTSSVTVWHMCVRTCVTLGLSWIITKIGAGICLHFENANKHVLNMNSIILFTGNESNAVFSYRTSAIRWTRWAGFSFTLFCHIWWTVFPLLRQGARQNQYILFGFVLRIMRLPFTLHLL